jgi:uncharacterized protein (TIGR00369 family)
MAAEGAALADESLAFGVHIPFVEALGMTLLRCAGGESELRMPLRPEFLNSWAVAHGGVLMSLLDVAMATAARSHDRAGLGVATVEMKTSFMRPAEGEHLSATGRLLHRSSTLAFCEATVHDDQGGMCAHATGTFKYIRALPSGKRQLRPLQRTDAQSPSNHTGAGVAETDA